MKRKKTIYIEEILWDKVKWLSQYRSKKAKTNDAFYTLICNILDEWAEREMTKVQKEDPEIFNALIKAISERANATEKLQDLMKKDDTKPED